MSTVEGKKQEKRRALLDAAYELFLERGTAKTSVEDITSRAKVAKGTFYLYFQDKGAVMQALLGRVSYQLLNNACEAVERQTGLETFPDKMVAVIDHIIEALRRDTVVLKFLERNFVWPGLDQIEASRDAEALMRKLRSPSDVDRDYRDFYRIFDETFLGIFPDFVEQVNALLEEPARFPVRADRTLPTELRILAVMRLGITDSGRIAGFLNCASATVYTYRTKLRNSALGSRSDFENRIRHIGL